MRINFNKARFIKVSILSISIWGVVIVSGCLLYSFGFRCNLTASLPLGVWKINKSFTRIERGDYVWFVPTKEIADFALKRGYLIKNNRCENNTIPLLKVVYGLPGDTYFFYEKKLLLNNLPVKNVERRKTDSLGRIMPTIPNGEVLENQLFVLTTNSHSFDSRYYGAIPIENVKGTAKPIFTWMK